MTRGGIDLGLRGALAALALSLAACWQAHGAGPAAPDAPDAPLTALEFAEALEQLVCARVMRCAGPSDTNAYFDAAPDADCTEYFRYLRRDDLLGSARRGVLRLDAGAARACLAFLAHDCSFAGDERCERALTGTLPDGAPCRGAAECAPGLFCDAGLDDPALCGGACRPAGALGAACAGGIRACAAGLACTTAGTCQPLVREPRAEGEPCQLVERGDGTVLRPVCGPELYCLDVCRAYPPAGSLCALDGPFPQCAGGTACLDDGTGARRCVAPTIATEPGAPCDEARAELCDRLHGLACLDGACRVVGGPGGSCDPLYAAWDCAPDLACVDGTCQPPLARGAVCLDERACAPGDACVGGRCAAPETACD